MQAYPPIIVSMTSYPARIRNVAKSIFLILSYQTLKPDAVHLWLAEQQFPGRNADLPKDLLAVCKLPKVHLHWVPGNTYVHKRHEIFRDIDDAACVFLIDDDVRYSNDLIERVMSVHKKHPDCIVCYNNYTLHKYNGRRIVYENSTLGPGPHVNKVRWCGQSMIPARLYPREILDEAHQKVRGKTSPVSDECWFQPWIVLHGIPIYYLSYGWGIDIDPQNGKNKGLVGWSHKKDANGYEKRDNWLHAVLSAYPDILKKYKKEFNYDG